MECCFFAGGANMLFQIAKAMPGKVNVGRLWWRVSRWDKAEEANNNRRKDDGKISPEKQKTKKNKIKRKPEITKTTHNIHIHIPLFTLTLVGAQAGVEAIEAAEKVQRDRLVVLAKRKLVDAGLCETKKKKRTRGLVVLIFNTNFVLISFLLLLLLSYSIYFVFVLPCIILFYLIFLCFCLTCTTAVKLGSPRAAKSATTRAVTALIFRPNSSICVRSVCDERKAYFEGEIKYKINKMRETGERVKTQIWFAFSKHFLDRWVLENAHLVLVQALALLQDGHHGLAILGVWRKVKVRKMREILIFFF